jgi:hypothetical protein
MWNLLELFAERRQLVSLSHWGERIAYTPDLLTACRSMFEAPQKLNMPVMHDLIKEEKQGVRTEKGDVTMICGRRLLIISSKLLRRRGKKI